MSYSNQWQVPEIQFSLKDIVNQTAIDPLFKTPQLHRSASSTDKNTRTVMRQPGQITNLRKTTVSHTLNVFKPFHQGDLQQFYDKKQIVVSAIEAIYLPYSNGSIISHKTKPQRHEGKIFNYRKGGTPQISAERSNLSQYSTPNKAKRNQGSSIIYRNSSCRSASAKKMDYQPDQTTFSAEQIAKLRRRMGMLK